MRRVSQPPPQVHSVQPAQKPLPRFGGQFEDGFYAAFTDGWPRFLSREVAPETLYALISRGDG